MDAIREERLYSRFPDAELEIRLEGLDLRSRRMGVALLLLFTLLVALGGEAIQ